MSLKSPDQIFEFKEALTTKENGLHLKKNGKKRAGARNNPGCGATQSQKCGSKKKRFRKGDTRVKTFDPLVHQAPLGEGTKKGRKNSRRFRRGCVSKLEKKKH